MRQLTGIDNYFLLSERKNIHNHVAALGVYDPSTAPGGSVRFKDILRHFQRRAILTPALRRRLVTPPFGIDRPYWVDSADLDIEFHVRHIALPHPGDWRQLMIQVARLHSRPLDRNNPLWEVYVIGGLDNIAGLPAGSFALFCKFHHAQFDGTAAAHLLGALHDLSPEDAEGLDGEEKLQSVVGERDPLLLELYARAVGHGLSRLRGLGSFVVTAAKTMTRLANATLARERLSDHDRDALAAALGRGKAPTTRFSHPVSGHRSVEAVPLPFAQIKAIRSVFPEATLNDVFLTICGGALRRYLDAKGELPSQSLRALMPISLRSTVGDAGKSNEIGSSVVVLRSDLADPVERLHAVHIEAEIAKRSTELIGPELVEAINEALPFSVAEVILRKFLVEQLNCTVSNVRGPSQPLFIAGARAVHMYPVSIPTDGIALNFTGFSYNEVLWISCVSCRALLPDPAFLADCLRLSAADLYSAAQTVEAQRTQKPMRVRTPRLQRKPAATTGVRTNAKLPLNTTNSARKSHPKRAAARE